MHLLQTPSDTTTLTPTQLRVLDVYFDTDPTQIGGSGRSVSQLLSSGANSTRAIAAGGRRSSSSSRPSPVTMATVASTLRSRQTLCPWIAADLCERRAVCTTVMRPEDVGGDITYLMTRVGYQQAALVVHASPRMHGTHLHCVELKNVNVYLLAPFRVGPSELPSQLLAHSQSALIENCVDCTFVLGPVASTLCVRNAVNCTVTTIAARLVLNYCRSVRMNVRTRLRPVLIHSLDVILAPYHTNYLVSIQWNCDDLLQTLADDLAEARLAVDLADVDAPNWSQPVTLDHFCSFKVTPPGCVAPMNMPIDNKRHPQAILVRFA